MVFRILLSLLCGIGITACILQHDESIKTLVSQYCTPLLEQAIGSSVQFHIKKLNIFALTVDIENLTARSTDSNDWHWHCKQIRMRFSLLELIYNNAVGMHLYLEGIDAQCALHDTHLDIIPHIAFLLSDSTFNIPLSLKSIIFHRATLHAYDKEKNNRLRLAWDSVHKWLHDRFQSTFYITNGICIFNDTDYCADCMGTVELVSSYTGHEKFRCTTDLRWSMPQLPSESNIWFCTGNFINNYGIWHIRNINDSCIINPCILDTSNNDYTITAHANIPIQYYPALFYNKKPVAHLEGESALNLAIHIGQEISADSTIHLSPTYYNENSICTSGILNAQYNNGIMDGEIDYHHNNAHVQGLCTWDTHTTSGSVHLTAASPISLHPWFPLVLQSEKSSADISYNPDDMLYSEYHLIGKQKDNTHTIDGMFLFDNSTASVYGKLDDYAYQATALLNPFAKIKDIQITKNGKSLCACTGYAPDYEHFKSIIDIALIKPLVESYSLYEIQGAGNITLFGNMQPEKIALKAHLENATIRIPHIYNVINGFDIIGSLDFAQHLLSIHACHCNLYEGCCTSKKAIIRYDEEWNPFYTSIPLTLNNCLININKDLFTNISGNVLFTHKPSDCASITGSLSLTRSHLTENLFSGELHERLMKNTASTIAPHGIDPKIDIKIDTQQPIRIRTSFLEGQALGNIHFSGSLHEPAAIGSIKLTSGSLSFPYKPLYINKGSIIVNPQQLDDPFIELIAKNKIKRYLVTLTVTGSLKNHQIHLESSPTLRDEQIIALLFAGSEEESLSSIAPALVLHNVKNLIFGEHSSSVFHKYFSKALKPLKYVHFVPSFTDQTGRGGLRGTIEVDINDRWRAVIQRNFNLFEDTRFELEYIVSDDISLKGIRDEHRDVSGEVEMRWKF